jgi:hypothetical protein
MSPTSTTLRCNNTGAGGRAAREEVGAEGRVIRLDVEYGCPHRYKAVRRGRGNLDLAWHPPATHAEEIDLGRLLALALLVLVLGGVVFLATWDIPPPTATVETVIPDERLPR